MALMTLPSTTDPDTTVTKKKPTSEASDEGQKPELGEWDVLLGRGARTTCNSGNIAFRQVVRSRLHDYLNAPRRQDKDQIAREILGVIKSRKGRFLRKVESVDGENSSHGEGGSSDFVSVEDDVALLKVKQALRDQKLGDSTSAALKNDASNGKKADSPFGPRGFTGSDLEAAGLVAPSQAFQPVRNGGSTAEALLLSQYLNQAPLAAPRATYPEGLLAASVGLGLPAASALVPPTLLQASHLLEARQEAILRSALLAQSTNALKGLAGPAASLSPIFGGAATLPPTQALLDAEARLQLIQQANVAESIAAALRTRAAGFQEPGDVLDAERALKRHKPN